MIRGAPGWKGRVAWVTSTCIAFFSDTGAHEQIPIFAFYLDGAAP
jgi:hypothetical protein